MTKERQKNITREEKKRIARIEKKILHNLRELASDWKKLFSKKKVAKQKRFLKKMAGEIKELENLSAIAEQFPQTEKTGLIIHDLLTTPWGIPINYDISLLEAALEFDQSKLFKFSHLLEDFAKYSSLVENDILKMIGELCSTIKEK